MTTIVTPSTDTPSSSAFYGPDALLKKLGKDGRFPPVRLLVRPLTAPAGKANISTATTSASVTLDRFLSYQFSSSVLIPVDSFSFSFVAPDGPPLYDVMKDGDLVQLTANGVTLATGIIDTVDIETDREAGEKGTLNGRDLMSQLEDQDAISMDSSAIWVEETSIPDGVLELCADTRITAPLDLRSVPGGNEWLLATEPGESKLAALQRFIEPFNILAWMRGDGKMIVGKPNMAQAPSGTIICSKGQRTSNVLSIKATRSATSIPNAVVPIWAGAEYIVNTQQAMKNKAFGPDRLYKLGHKTLKTVVISTPNAPEAQSLSDLNFIQIVDLVDGGNLLRAYGKREIARKNTNELLVQAVVPGHYNDSGRPYVIDTTYNVVYDRGSVNEKMYLFQVDYDFSLDGGQMTTLHFCKLGTIVADLKAF
jgi:prophage tail gpP-like protein